MGHSIANARSDELTTRMSTALLATVSVSVAKGEYAHQIDSKSDHRHHLQMNRKTSHKTT